MDVNRVPLTRGKVSAAQLANFQKWTKGELRTAIIMGVAGAACWKLVHWSEKRKMTAMNEAVKAENAEVGDVAALLASFLAVPVPPSLATLTPCVFGCLLLLFGFYCQAQRVYRARVQEEMTRLGVSN